MNFNYGNNNYNFFNNYNMNNNVNYLSNLNINKNIGSNNFNNFNNNPMNKLLQYINLFNSNTFNNNHLNNTAFNKNINNTNFQNTTQNIFQLMPNIIKYGFNQPYSFENTKKESKIIHPSNFKSKLYFKNNSDNIINISYDNTKDDSNERKFMRKMTKAEKIEIDKWFEARKKLYPTKKNIELKKKLGEIKVEKGLVSDLELKLRKKVNILKKLNTSKKIKFNNNFNKNFPNFQKRKKELKEMKEKNALSHINNINKISENNIISNNNENIIEDGEIVDEIKSINNNENGEGEDKNKINDFIGKKRERKNIKKKLGENMKLLFDNKNKEKNGFKKGFKYKSNNLYDELIKKEKIKEQNILLQAIRYLINLKDE